MLVLTFFTDLVSTTYFILKGLSNNEGNLIIWFFGSKGFIPAILLNPLIIYVFLRLLQKHRHDIKERFNLISTVVGVTLFRFFVSITNFYHGATATINIKPTTTELLLNYGVIFGIIFLLIFPAIISFKIFRKTHHGTRQI